MKSILPNDISDSQSAFVPDRLIIDNTTMAFEMSHKMQNRRQGKVGHMAAKLDISEAYDSVEWNFLKRIMLRLVFLVPWVNLAMTTVRIASYSILINGERCGYVTPLRGIK